MSQNIQDEEVVKGLSNGGPPSVPLTPKAKLECIRGILERADLTPIQKCTGVGLVVCADKEWVSEVKTADLQRMSSAKDRETVFKATKKLDDEGIISKASSKGQSGKYNILPPKMVEAVIEAFEELQSSRAQPDHKTSRGPTGNPVGFDPTTQMEPVGFEPTSRVQPDQPSRARIETPSGLLNPKKVEDNPPLSPDGYEARVAFENGRLVIFNGLRQFWLEKFGGDEKLDLALAQAAGYVQPNSMKPLEAQVSSQLAKMVRDKLDKDDRYNKAVKANKAAPAGAAEGESKAQRWGRMMREIEADEAKKAGPR